MISKQDIKDRAGGEFLQASNMETAVFPFSLFLRTQRNV